MWQRAVLFSVGYLACAMASTLVSVPGTPFITFWLPGGLYVVVLWLNPRRDWFWLCLATFPANLAFDLPYGTRFVIILCFFGANTVQAVTGAWLIRRFVCERPTLATLKELLGVLGFAAVFSPMLGAAIGAGALTMAGITSSFSDAWALWWGTNALAVLVLSPFILIWFARPTASGSFRFQRGRMIEAVCLALVLALFTWHLLFCAQGVMTINKSWQLLPLLWAGLRFGPRGATAANLFVALTLAYFTTQHFKGLTPAQIASAEYVFILQSSVVVAVLVGLIPAIIIGERDRTMAELRGSEERFKNLAGAAFEGIVISESGRVLDANEQALKMFGHARNEILGKEIMALIAPESRETVAEAFRTGREEIYGHQLLRKDGSTFAAEAQARVVHLGDRTVRMTALRDITERRRAEESLRKSETLFRSYFELAMVGCAITSLEMGLVAVNDQYCALVGYTREELKKMTWKELTHPDDIAADLTLFKQLVAGEIDSYTLEKRYLHKTGRKVFVTLSVRCVRHPDGSPDYFVGLVVDTTENKRAEQALQENQRMLKTLLSNLPGMAYRCENNINWTMNFVSEGSRELTGYFPEDFLNNQKTSYGQIIHDDDRLHVWHTIQAALEQRRQFELTYRIRTADGTEKWVWERGRGIFLENGDLFALEGFITDITSKRQAELERVKAVQREQLARTEYTFQLIASQEAERARIAAELHDSLGQNLLIIKNRAQLALTKDNPDENVREQMESISALASQAIGEVRHISHDLHPYQLDHLGLTRAIEAMVDNAAQASGIVFEQKLDPVDDAFSKDAALNLYRVAQESLNNILKHSNAKKAQITLERDVHDIQLHIADDGCGFANGNAFPHQKGMGLKNMAERVRILNGTLKTESRPDHGTRITVTIPTTETG